MQKPCEKCKADTERNSRGGCINCERKRSAERRAANPEKARAACAQWRLKNKDRVREYNAKWNEDNHEKKISGIAAWRSSNEQRIREYALEYRAANREKRICESRAWRLSNLERHHAMCAAWKAENPHVLRIQNQNRRSRKRESGGKLSPKLAEKLFNLQRGKCACCGLPLGGKYHLDHIMPLALGGTNTDDNIQLLRDVCNFKKHMKHPIDFMQSKGFLL